MTKKEIEDVAKIAIKNITKKDLEFTPQVYEKEFCSTSFNLKMTSNECEYLKNSLKELKRNGLEIKQNKIETTYDLLDLIVQKIQTNNLNLMSKIFQDSMQPSISLKLDPKLEAFCVKIGDSPALIFEESIQKEIQSFIEKRFEVDKVIVAKKTADIARLVTLMSRYLNDAIATGKEGSNNISQIHKKLQLIKTDQNSQGELVNLHKKLESAAKNIQSELDTVNTNFISQQDEILKLENKVQELQKELHEAKKNNDTDFLTQVVNRKGFEKHLEKFEEIYTHKAQDYAVVFFDIDHFKKINDTYGHECGDTVLKTFASIINKLTSKENIVARYGGEEFVVLLHYKSNEGLCNYLSKIKNIVNKNLFIYKENKIHITFSAGVQLRSAIKKFSSLVTSADELLYESKSGGRDMIKLWDNTTL